jgi:DNA-binding NtrC family response regulator
LGSILIVEDDRRLRENFEKLLVSEGHAVQGIETGEMGIEMIRSGAPDLVILDVRLPGMNGLETFRAIRRIEPRLPVILVTAYSTHETANQATELGAFAFVPKPFDIPQMLRLIHQALETA